MTDKSDRDPHAGRRTRGGDDAEATLRRAETLAVRAQEAFETTVEALEDAVRNLKATPEIGEREVLRDVRAMNSALMLAMDMQEKARVAGSKHFGGGTGACLDLGAARAEIRARLARLRDAAGGDGVS